LKAFAISRLEVFQHSGLELSVDNPNAPQADKAATIIPFVQDQFSKAAALRDDFRRIYLGFGFCGSFRQCPRIIEVDLAEGFVGHD
jgi:hypothetical protein